MYESPESVIAAFYWYGDWLAEKLPYIRHWRTTYVCTSWCRVPNRAGAQNVTVSIIKARSVMFACVHGGTFNLAGIFRLLPIASSRSNRANPDRIHAWHRD